MKGKKKRNLGVILSLCVLTGVLAAGMSGCGKDKENDGQIQELLTPTPGPTPTPEPSGGSVAKNGDITMVNEYLNQKANGQIDIPVTTTPEPSSGDGTADESGDGGSEYSEDGTDYSEDGTDYSEDGSDYSDDGTDYSEDGSGYDEY